ncbi:MAG: class I SAM-dependent methyltransferase [Planctomycetales bacterium]|nr:class I SAM-dependent methyltransferase [Planctomycetales bacterium]
MYNSASRRDDAINAAFGLLTVDRSLPLLCIARRPAGRQRDAWRLAKECMMSVSTLAFPAIGDSGFASPPPVAAAPPAPLTSPETVTDCYDVLDMCRSCGITDFTDGKYVAGEGDDRASYLAAQQRQADFLLDQIDCRRRSRVLDIGCGYGRILASAGSRGADAQGITLSPPQLRDCRRRGLAVYLCNYRELFANGGYDRWAHAYDGIVANGSLEHFVQTEDAAAGRADEIYREFFAICRRLLKPDGKLATTAIHARRVGQINPRDLVSGPQALPTGSEVYHAANLHRSFGGWYPEPGQLERCAAGFFELTAAEDGTDDYLRTSEYWVRQIKRSLIASPPAWAASIAAFARRPRAAWNMLRCLLWDQSWNYQFRNPAPAQLWRHTWRAL